MLDISQKSNEMNTTDNQISNREKYLEKAEIKVKNLLSELYEDESETLDEKVKVRERLNKELLDLENHFNDINDKRTDLQLKFKNLKEANNKNWEKVKNEFEMILKYVEGDKESFITKAEALISDLSLRIAEMEQDAMQYVDEAKEQIEQRISTLKNSRFELQEKVNKIKADTSDQWREIQHWFIEKTESVKSYLSNIKSS